MPTEKFPQSEDGRLRLAIQKSGRLADDTFDLLRNCGLKVRQSRSQLFARIEELPIDVLQVRDDDIPQLVANGASDVGIVGGNVFTEEQMAGGTDFGATVVEELGFSRCRLCIALPKSDEYTGPESLKGIRIATSYPALTQDWCRKNGADDVKIVIMHGAHEIAPKLGVAEGICDIVSTGATLETNGLRVVETIFQSQAMLIGRPDLPQAQRDILEKLLGRIRGVLASRHAKYVMMNAPADAVDDICGVLPGADSPTVLSLAGHTNKVAIHVVCNEDVLWEQLSQLKSVGARDILVLDIDKMLP